MLSAVIITLNEAENIARCVRSVSFCDEVIVVDAGSTDATCEIAKDLGAQVVSMPWQGFVKQRNEALKLAAGDWIFSIDADEEVSPELRNEICAVVKQGDFAYTVPRKTIHFGRWIRHGGWYPNRLVRLFKKQSGEWQGGDLHEFWAPRVPVKELKGDLLHYSFKSLSDQVERNNRYSSLGATTLQKKGKQFSVVRLFIKPITKFLETYVYKRGFLDGYPGFIISISAAYSVFLKWAKLWEMQNAEKAN